MPQIRCYPKNGFKFAKLDCFLFKNLPMKHTLAQCKRILLASIITFLTVPGFSGQILDSLRSIHKNVDRLGNTEKANLLNELAENTFFIHGDSALKYAGQALKYAKKENYIEGIAKSYRLIGIGYYLLANDDSTKHYFYQALSYSAKNQVYETQADMLLVIAEAMQYEDKYDSARIFLDSARAIIKKYNITKPYTNIYADVVDAQYYLNFSLSKSLEYSLAAYTKSLKYNDKKKQEESLSSIANTFAMMGDVKKAKAYCFLELNMAIEAEIHTGMMNACNRLIKIYYNESKYDSCIYFGNMALKKAKETNNLEFESITKARLVPIHIANKDFKKASLLLNEIYQYQKGRNQINELVQLHHLFATYYLAKNELDSALKSGQIALNYSEKAKDLGFIYNQYYLLHKIYRKKKDFSKALLYLEKYYDLKDSLKNIESIKNVNLLNTQYETTLKEQKIKELEQEKKLEELALARRNYQIVAVIIAFVLIAVVFFLVFLRYKANKKKQLLEAELKTKETQIANASAELKAIKAQMNPHFMFNALDSIQELILTDNKPLALEQVSRFAKLSRDILRASTQQGIDIEDEAAFLREYLELEKLRFSNDFSYEINIPEDILNSDISLPPMLIQPYVENALKHGLLHKIGEKILKINFELDKQGKKLIITVTDNGIGLKNSKERNKNRKNHQSFATNANHRRVDLLNEQAGFEKYSVTINDILNEHDESVGCEVKVSCHT